MQDHRNGRRLRITNHSDGFNYFALRSVRISKSSACMDQVPEKRGKRRVEFSRGIDVQIVAIDGTWSRACSMLDVSEHGAKLVIDGSVQGLAMKEFFLVFSTIGTAYRRCQLSWVNGEQVGVSFLGRPKRKHG